MSRPSRRRAHIAMVGIPAISHVLPSLEVIRELVARGHRVTYANDPFVAHVIEPTGAAFVPYRSTLPVADNDWPDDPIAAGTVFLDDAIQALPQLRAVYDEDPADLYLYDIGGYAGRALAEAQGRPTLQLSPTFVAWEGYAEEVGAALKALPGADAYQEKFASWLAGCGATTLDPDLFSGRPERAVAVIPRAMQPNADRVNTEVVTFVGPCLGDRADQGGWERPAGAEKVLLVSLGWRRTPGRPPSTASASRPSGICPGGMWCCRSASTSNWPSWGRSRATSRCTAGCRSRRSWSGPTPSSPMPGWAAALRGCTAGCR
ncbi:hypothetical protein SANTM175S_07562 [Streptomyces antimycoticus]